MPRMEMRAICGCLVRDLSALKTLEVRSSSFQSLQDMYKHFLTLTVFVSEAMIEKRNLRLDLKKMNEMFLHATWFTHSFGAIRLYSKSVSEALRMDYIQHRSLYLHDKLDLLIMPLNLKQFAKIDKETNTLCIKPSFVTRQNNGGTYVLLYVMDSHRHDVEDYTDWIRVDILRI